MIKYKCNWNIVLNVKKKIFLIRVKQWNEKWVNECRILHGFKTSKYVLFLLWSFINQRKKINLECMISILGAKEVLKLVKIYMTKVSFVKKGLNIFYSALFSSALLII